MLVYHFLCSFMLNNFVFGTKQELIFESDRFQWVNFFLTIPYINIVIVMRKQHLDGDFNFVFPYISWFSL